jgi:hypothetical protein
MVATIYSIYLSDNDIHSHIKVNYPSLERRKRRGCGVLNLMTDIGAALTLLFCLGVLALPKRQASLAYIAAVLYITEGQSTDVGGINMMAMRFVEVAATIRVVFRGELASSSMRMTRPDVFLLLFFLAYMSVTMFRTGELDKYTLGLTVDGVLVYFAVRALIATPEDFTYFMKGMILLIVPFAMMMMWEAVKGQNLFYYMGGVPEIPDYREGYFRSQGSFRHSITAGSVGATFFPVFMGFLFIKTCRAWALLGVAASLSIVITSHSSGPLMTAIVAAGAWCCWFVRQNMKWVRRGIVAVFIGLNMMMSAPVWFVFDRISGVIGGDGWHRSNIIDKFIYSIGDWWLVGMPMEKTKDWAATLTRFGAADITNYYVSIGINGGLISLLLFIALLVTCFKLVGSGLQCLRSKASQKAAFEPVLWGAGCAVCAHAVNLTAVSYWDQIYVIWYSHLAMTVTLSYYFFKDCPKISPEKKNSRTST